MTRTFDVPYPNGIFTYERVYGGERLIRVLTHKGEEQYYEGEPGAERMVRATYPTGQVDFYEGERGAERIVQVVFYDLSTAARVWREKQFYEGEPGAERMVRVAYPNGRVTFYEGEPDAERVVRRTSPDGKEEFYEGGPGHERLVRLLLPARGEGERRGEQYYDGERGAERRMSRLVPLSNGEVRYYEGGPSLQDERLTKTVDRHGIERYLHAGPRGAERVYLTAGPNFYTVIGDDLGFEEM